MILRLLRNFEESISIWRRDELTGAELPSVEAHKHRSSHELEHELTATILLNYKLTVDGIFVKILGLIKGAGPSLS